MHEAKNRRFKCKYGLSHVSEILLTNPDELQPICSSCGQSGTV